MRLSKNKHALVITLATICACGLLSACAPQELTSVSSTGPGSGAANEPAAVQTTWSMDSDCATCHATEAATASNASCLYAKHSTLSCVTCHDDEAGLVAVHADSDASNPASLTRLSETDVSPDLCATCHDSAELAESTADSEALKDKQGNVVNPHDLPGGSQHEKIDCITCHQYHVADTQPGEVGLAYCSNGQCHHEGVLECNTCHN